MSSGLAVKDGAFVVQDGSFVTESSYDGGGSGGGGDSPQTIPTQAPADRASQAGLTINTIKVVTSTSQITGEPNTLYIIDGNSQTGTPTVMTDGGNPNTLYEIDGDSQDPFTWDGPMNLGSIDDTAICGINDASIPVPAGFRDYMVTVSGGSGFLWSGVDIDQTASGAWGRFNINTSDNGIIEFVKTMGKGRRANPDPSGEYGATTGPTISIPSTSSSGTNHIRNAEFIHGGVLANNHDHGDRPIGIFLSTDHVGTLRIERSAFEEFANNALYATNTTGSVICADTRFWNNGVSNGRIAFGEFINCTIGYDYTDTGMMNADAPNHGCSGISVDDKGHGTDVDVTNCSVHMINVAKTGGGIVAQDFGAGGSFDRIEETDVHVHNVPNNEPDINISPNGASVNAIVNCTFEGSADGGVSIDNNGPSVTVSGNTFSYPDGRQHYEGAID